MTVQIDFKTVLETIDTSWKAFQETFEGLNDEQLADPTAVGYWSAGDLAFHIAYWDNVAAADAQHRHDNNGNRPPERDWQSMNDADYARHKDQSVSEGFAAMASAHVAMLARFESLKDDDFTWAIAELVDHYDEHAGDIRSWRAARGI